MFGRGKVGGLLVALAAAYVTVGLSRMIVQADDAPPALFKKLTAGDMAPLNDKQKKILEHARHDPATMDVQLVEINAAALDQPVVSINASGGQPLRAERSATKGTKDVWAGKIHSSPQDVFLSTTGQNSYGRIITKEGLYVIKPLGNGVHVLIKQDAKKLPDEHPPANKEGVRTKGGERPAEPKNQADAPPKAKVSPGSTANQAPVLDVLVAYTAAVEALNVDMDGLIKASADAANLCYQNSQINLTLRVVATLKETYTESGTFDTDLARLAGKGDGFLDDVHALRDSSGADVVVLLIDNHSFCGLADAIQADADTAFACVDHTCAAGNLSFAHEIGHLQGARHNPEVDNTGTPFSFGHGLLMSDGTSRTVMAYDDGTGRVRVPYFSNPDVSVNGIPTGVSGANDNARVLNQTSTTVTKFRP